MTRTRTSLDRQQGRYYTPRFLVEGMLRLALDPLLAAAECSRRSPLRILDPACGDGVFLAAIAERMGALVSAGGRDSSIPAVELFGVDIDRAALEVLKSRLPESGGIRWGDSLTGRGFGELVEGIASEIGPTEIAPAVDWPSEFPAVAEAGGFDLVIGNPPYRRELASKQLLDRLIRSPLGQRWHQPRLDLWAYFLHRGLDLVREGGRLAFVLPSYWTASTCAAQLIERLRRESTICDVVLLGRARVFPNVEGWHLILHLIKGTSSRPSRVWDLSESGERLGEDLQVLNAISPMEEWPGLPSDGRCVSLGPAELFQQGQLCLSPPEPVLQLLMNQARHALRARFFVRQGIVENPRCITRKLLKLAPGEYELGEGVFVLSPAEVEQLELSPQEANLLRPYYRGTDIERYWLSESPSEHLLYLTRETAPRLEALPAIQAHLSRFRKLLENRREVRNGQLAWWHLHWPRNEQIFLAPRILMPQMGHAPRFVFCERPAFVGFSMHALGVRALPGVARKPGADARTKLLALTGVLNSALASRWFQRFAKHRGVALDISGTLLKRFPLPAENPEAESALAGLVWERQQLGANVPEISELEAEIEDLVRKWYALPPG